MMDQYCGSVQANVEKARCFSEETLADSNGHHISAKKKKERHDRAPTAITSIALGTPITKEVQTPDFLGRQPTLGRCKS